MSLTPNEQPITTQLLSTMKEMRDFLLDNPIATNSSDLQKYENLYTKINTLSIKTLAEGYVGYKHNNPHKTLSEFLNSGVIGEQVLKYYTEPVFKKDIILFIRLIFFRLRIFLKKYYLRFAILFQLFK